MRELLRRWHVLKIKRFLHSLFPVGLFHRANDGVFVSNYFRCAFMKDSHQQILDLVVPDPKAALAVEKFKENFMPLFELSRRCRTWSEFAMILRQADSPDQIKVLTKMVSASPGAAKRLSQVLTLLTDVTGAPAGRRFSPLMWRRAN